MTPTLQDAYQLFHDGSLALSEVERAGIRIDVKRLDRSIKGINEEIKDLTEEVKDSREWTLWVKRWGKKTNVGSRYQLGVVLFESMGLECKTRTETGRPKVDETVLEDIGTPFVKNFLKLEKLKKVRTTYLMGIRREVVDGFLHPAFSLNLVRTFRSSSSDPNLQNMPIRDPIYGKIIRSCFIPREGHVLVEADFGALEFGVSACKWNDPSMIAYASDPNLDIHRDMAAECYLLPVDRVPKQCRFYAKNKFVFPTLYGSNFIPCSKNLWNAIDLSDLKNADGVPLKDHLVDYGITELGRTFDGRDPEPGTFQEHIKQVEQRFHEMFPVWAEEKELWWDKYLKRGYFDMMTGFRCAGSFSRNDLYNWCIQGPAFHLLLWCLIQMVDYIKQNKMKSRVVGEIHDSLLMDIHQDEFDEMIQKVTDVMTVDVRKHWDWVVVPLKVEIEVAERNWFGKKPLEV